MIFLDAIIYLLGIYSTLYVIYILILVFAHFFIKKIIKPSLSSKTRFCIIIPAYNEELLLARLLQSINIQHYPRGLFESVVVADNCTDRTVDVARESGAIVFERKDEYKRGKGYAIQWALERIDMSQYDAALIVDADCVISNRALWDLDIMIQAGKRVIQCYSGIDNPNDSWFTRLLDVSRMISNEIYHPAKQLLGLSSTLMGTGMCFTSHILRKYGWHSFSVGEDCEYYAKLLLNDETIDYSSDARVYHRESSSLNQATTQRIRWSSGKFAILWKYGFRLLLRGLLERNIVKFDAALTLLFPNPSLGINITLLALAASLLLPLTHAGAIEAWFFILCILQMGIFIIGVFYTENKLSKFASIFVAPVFLVWKMGIDILSIVGVGRNSWVRTRREL
jgi:cellulose synthase/poly-beta-1,6-N-acetylglucosamine synthase-like glycosyltransferase